MTTLVSNREQVRYANETVDGVNIFYRESGVPSKKALLLLHGFPTSSHMYREVLSALGDQYYVIAPDYPGFGNSEFPSTKDYDYTFENIASTIDKFLEQKGIEEFILTIQDYGAPIGFRIAMKHPERVKGLVAMNGNAYEDGLGPGWEILHKYWDNRSSEIEEQIISNAFSFEGLKWQYTHGTQNPEGILPDNWIIDYHNFSREGQHEMQLGLFYDYQNNIKLYPQWQQFLKDYQPPTLVVWGKNDVYFPESGAEAFRRDLKDIDYNIYDTGHFPLEEHSASIIEKMKKFLVEKL